MEKESQLNKSFDDEAVLSLIKRVISNKDFARLRNRFDRQSLFSILSVENRELQHSAVLKWFFSLPTVSTHRNGPLALMLRLYGSELLSGGKSSSSKLDTQEMGNVVLGNYEILSCKVQTEEYVENQKQKGRIDVWIKGEMKVEGKSVPYHVIIENKVESKEHKCQTSFYAEYMKRLKGLVFPIFLTPKVKGDGDEISCESERFVKMTYPMLMEEIMEPMLSHPYMTKRDKFILEEYLYSLSDYTIKNRNELNMGIEKRTEELLTSVWKNNKDLFVQFLRACSEVFNDKELQECANYINNKDMSKYDISDHDGFQPKLATKNCSKVDSVACCVEILLNRYMKEGLNFEEALKKVNEISTGIGDKKLVGTDLHFNGYSDPEKRCKSLDFTLEGQEGKKKLYVFNQWKPDNFGKFMDQMENLSIKIKKMI